MEKIIVFTSTKDHEMTFENAVDQERWENLHSRKSWINNYDSVQFAILIGKNGDEPYMSDLVDQYSDFDLMLIYEPPELDPDELTKSNYKNILNSLSEKCREYCEYTEKLYVIKHRSSGNYHSIQDEFAKGLSPNANYIPNQYSHIPSDDLFKKIAFVLASANDSRVTLEQFRSLFRLLITGLSFPGLYDKAAEIQIEIFRESLKNIEKYEDKIVGAKKGGVIILHQPNLQKKYETFIKEVLKQDPENREVNSCSEETTMPDTSLDQSTDSIKIYWDEFTEHLNQVLCSEGLRK